MALRNLTRERALWAMKCLERAERIEEGIYLTFTDEREVKEIKIGDIFKSLEEFKREEDRSWIWRKFYRMFESYKEGREGERSEEQIFDEWKEKIMTNFFNSLSSKFLENYINTSKRLPQLIKTNGLIATVSFLLSKDDYARKQVVVDLSEWLQRAGYGISPEDEYVLLSYLLDPDTKDLLRPITMEALAFAIWLKRMAEVKESESSRKES